MKTALIKTTMWDDDDFYDLNIDTKLVYLLLLSCPERGVGSIYKMSDILIVARSGLNQHQIDNCKSQLEAKKMMAFYKGYILILNSANIEPKRGRFTEEALEKESHEVPADVYDHFRPFIDTGAQNSSRGTLEYVYGDVNVDVKVKEATPKFEDKDVELAKLLYTLRKGNFESFTKQPAESDFREINKLHRLDGAAYVQIEYIIRWCQDSDFWRKVIESGGGLRRNYPKMIGYAEADWKKQQRNRSVKI